MKDIEFVPQYGAAATSRPVLFRVLVAQLVVTTLILVVLVADKLF